MVKVTVSGHAWAGLRTVEKLQVSYDYGTTWHDAKLSRPVNKGAWQQWEADLGTSNDGLLRDLGKKRRTAKATVSPLCNRNGIRKAICSMVVTVLQSECRG
ncbi:hypothetical protein O9993_08030 [Vibrio lentus]|nr:hypothetical protein [Vibrio lentus]